MTPIIVLTGYLGSGKTTLLGQFLKRPELSNSAVIINEFGEIGLDHDFVAGNDTALIELETGCLCCISKSSLAETLTRLVNHRSRQERAPFDRIIIETSGLADPAAIMHTVMADKELAQKLAVSKTITTIDALFGADLIDREPLALKQAALADSLVFTKTDLSQGVPKALDDRLSQVNALAARVIAVNGLMSEEDFSAAISQPSSIGKRWDELALQFQPDATPLHGYPQTFCLTRDKPISALTLALFMEALSEHFGRDILRLKGIIRLAESDQRPALIQGVEQYFHPTTLLPDWPTPDRSSRLVLIARDVQKAWIEALLNAVEHEVEASRLSS